MTSNSLFGRDSEYLAFIRSRACSFCGCPLVDPHHALKWLRGIRAGMLEKIDYVAVPACRQCHENVHNGVLKPSREELLELVVINLICSLDQLGFRHELSRPETAGSTP